MSSRKSKSKDRSERKSRHDSTKSLIEVAPAQIVDGNGTRAVTTQEGRGKLRRGESDGYYNPRPDVPSGGAAGGYTESPTHYSNPPPPAQIYHTTPGMMGSYTAPPPQQQHNGGHGGYTGGGPIYNAGYGIGIGERTPAHYSQHQQHQQQTPAMPGRPDYYHGSGSYNGPPAGPALQHEASYAGPPPGQGGLVGAYGAPPVLQHTQPAPQSTPLHDFPQPSSAYTHPVPTQGAKPPRRNSSSSSSSSSYIDISRTYPVPPIRRNPLGVIRTFFTAPSESRRRVVRRKSSRTLRGEREKMRMGRAAQGRMRSSSSSEVDSDLAYGVGYLRRRRRRSKRRGSVGKGSRSPGGRRTPRRYGSPGREGRRENYPPAGGVPLPGLHHSSTMPSSMPGTFPIETVAVAGAAGAIAAGLSRKDSNSHRDSKKGKKDAEKEILKLGEDLHNLAKRQNRYDLEEAAKRGRVNVVRYNEGRHGLGPKGLGGSPSRGIPSSRLAKKAKDDDGWETSDSDDTSSSSESADSAMAFGEENTYPSWKWREPSHPPRRGSKQPDQHYPHPPTRKSTIVDPELFGPQNSLQGVVTRPMGFGMVDDLRIDGPTPMEPLTVKQTGYFRSPLPSPRPAHRDEESRRTKEAEHRRREDPRREGERLGRRSLQHLFPVPTDDPGFVDVARASLSLSGSGSGAGGPDNRPSFHARTDSLPLSQPKPMSPVRRGVYESPSAEIEVGREGEKRDKGKEKERESSRSRSHDLALGGLAGAALAAGFAVVMRTPEIEGRGEKSKAKGRASEEAGYRDREGEGEIDSQRMFKDDMAHRNGRHPNPGPDRLDSYGFGGVAQPQPISAISPMTNRDGSGSAKVDPFQFQVDAWEDEKFSNGGGDRKGMGMGKGKKHMTAHERVAARAAGGNRDSGEERPRRYVEDVERDRARESEYQEGLYSSSPEILRRGGGGGGNRSLERTDFGRDGPRPLHERIASRAAESNPDTGRKSPRFSKQESSLDEEAERRIREVVAKWAPLARKSKFADVDVDVDAAVDVDGPVMDNLAIGESIDRGSTPAITTVERKPRWARDGSPLPPSRALMEYSPEAVREQGRTESPPRRRRGEEVKSPILARVKGEAVEGYAPQMVRTASGADHRFASMHDDYFSSRPNQEPPRPRERCRGRSRTRSPTPPQRGRTRSRSVMRERSPSPDIREVERDVEDRDGSRDRRPHNTEHEYEDIEREVEHFTAPIPVEDIEAAIAAVHAERGHEHDQHHEGHDPVQEEAHRYYREMELARKLAKQHDNDPTPRVVTPPAMDHHSRDKDGDEGERKRKGPYAEPDADFRFDHEMEPHELPLFTPVALRKSFSLPEHFDYSAPFDPKILGLARPLLNIVRPTPKPEQQAVKLQNPKPRSRSTSRERTTESRSVDTEDEKLSYGKPVTIEDAPEPDSPTTTRDLPPTTTTTTTTITEPQSDNQEEDVEDNKSVRWGATETQHYIPITPYDEGGNPHNSAAGGLIPSSPESTRALPGGMGGWRHSHAHEVHKEEAGGLPHSLAHEVHEEEVSDAEKKGKTKRDKGEDKGKGKDKEKGMGKEAKEGTPEKRPKPKSLWSRFTPDLAKRIQEREELAYSLANASTVGFADGDEGREVERGEVRELALERGRRFQDQDAELETGEGEEEVGFEYKGVVVEVEPEPPRKHKKKHHKHRDDVVEQEDGRGRERTRSISPPPVGPKPTSPISSSKMPGGFGDDREIAYATPRGVSPPASDVSTVIYYQASELSDPAAGIATGFNSEIGSVRPRSRGLDAEESFVDVTSQPHPQSREDSFVVVPDAEQQEAEETHIITVEAPGEQAQSFAVVESHSAVPSEETMPLIGEPDGKEGFLGDGEVLETPATETETETEGFVTPLAEVVIPLAEVVTPFDATETDEVPAPNIEAATLDAVLGSEREIDAPAPSSASPIDQEVQVPSDAAIDTPAEVTESSEPQTETAPLDAAIDSSREIVDTPTPAPVMEVYEEPEMPTGLNKKAKQAWKRKIAKEREAWDNAQTSAQTPAIDEAETMETPIAVLATPAAVNLEEGSKEIPHVVAEELREVDKNAKQDKSGLDSDFVAVALAGTAAAVAGIANMVLSGNKKDGGVGEMEEEAPERVPSETVDAAAATLEGETKEIPDVPIELAPQSDKPTESVQPTPEPITTRGEAAEYYTLSNDLPPPPRSAESIAEITKQQDVVDAAGVDEDEAGPGKVSVAVYVEPEMPTGLNKKQKQAWKKKVAREREEWESERTQASRSVSVSGAQTLVEPEKAVEETRDVAESESEIVDVRAPSVDVVQESSKDIVDATIGSVPAIVEAPIEGTEVSVGGKKKKKDGKGKAAEVETPVEIPIDTPLDELVIEAQSTIEPAIEAVSEPIAEVDPVAEALALLGGISHTRAAPPAVQESIEQAEQQLESPTDDDDAFHSAAEDRGRSETPTGTLNDEDDFHSTNGDNAWPSSRMNGQEMSGHGEPEVILKDAKAPAVNEQEVTADEEFAPVKGKKKKKKKGKGASGNGSGSGTPGGDDSMTESTSRHDSFLANAGTLGAGVGSAPAGPRDMNSGILGTEERNADGAGRWVSQPKTIGELVEGDKVGEGVREGTVVGVDDGGDVYAGQTWERKNEEVADPVEETRRVLEGIEHSAAGGKETDAAIDPLVNDPEIVEREVMPSIDPQFGDLLPLPPRDSPPNEEVDAQALVTDLPPTPLLDAPATFQPMFGIQEQNEPSELKEEVATIDPEIQQRDVRPAIDPQFGDLLELPPSQPGSPIRPVDDDAISMHLPDSPPESPVISRTSFDSVRDSPQTPRKKDTTHSMRSPSINAVPLKFLLGGRNSTPSSPVAGSATSPTRPKSRHSWDSSKGLQPLQLLERRHSRGSSLAEFESRALAPLLEGGKKEDKALASEGRAVTDEVVVNMEDTETPAETFATALSEKKGEEYFPEAVPCPVESSAVNVADASAPLPVDEALLELLPETPAATTEAEVSSTLESGSLKKSKKKKKGKKAATVETDSEPLADVSSLPVDGPNVLESEPQTEAVGASAKIQAGETHLDDQVPDATVDKSVVDLDAPIEDIEIQSVPAPVESKSAEVADTGIALPVDEALLKPLPETPAVATEAEVSSAFESGSSKKSKKKKKDKKGAVEPETEPQTEIVETSAEIEAVEAPPRDPSPPATVDRGLVDIVTPIEPQVEMPSEATIQETSPTNIEETTREVLDASPQLITEAVFDDPQPAKKLNKKQRQALAKKLKAKAEAASASTTGGWTDSGAQTPAEQTESEPVIETPITQEHQDIAKEIEQPAPVQSIAEVGLDVPAPPSILGEPAPVKFDPENVLQQISAVEPSIEPLTLDLSTVEAPIVEVATSPAPNVAEDSPAAIEDTALAIPLPKTPLETPNESAFESASSKKSKKEKRGKKGATVETDSEPIADVASLPVDAPDVLESEPPSDTTKDIEVIEEPQPGGEVAAEVVSGQPMAAVRDASTAMVDEVEPSIARNVPLHEVSGSGTPAEATDATTSEWEEPEMPRGLNKKQKKAWERKVTKEREARDSAHKLGNQSPVDVVGDTAPRGIEAVLNENDTESRSTIADDTSADAPIAQIPDDSVAITDEFEPSIARNLRLPDSSVSSTPPEVDAPPSASANEAYEEPEMPTGLNKKQKQAWKKKIAREREEWESAQSQSQVEVVQDTVAPPIETAPIENDNESPPAMAEDEDEGVRKIKHPSAIADDTPADAPIAHIPDESMAIVDEFGPSIAQNITLPDSTGSSTPPEVAAPPSASAIEAYEEPEMPTGLNKKQRKAWEKKVAREREEWESALELMSQSPVEVVQDSAAPRVETAPIENDNEAPAAVPDLKEIQHQSTIVDDTPVNAPVAQIPDESVAITDEFEPSMARNIPLPDSAGSGTPAEATDATTSDWEDPGTPLEVSVSINEDSGSSDRTPDPETSQQPMENTEAPKTAFLERSASGNGSSQLMEREEQILVSDTGAGGVRNFGDEAMQGGDKDAEEEEMSYDKGGVVDVGEAREMPKGLNKKQRKAWEKVEKKMREAELAKAEEISRNVVDEPGVASPESPDELKAEIADAPIEVAERAAQTIDIPAPPMNVGDETSKDIADASVRRPTDVNAAPVDEASLPHAWVFEQPEMPKGLNKKQKKAWERKMAKEREDWECDQASTEASGAHTPLVDIASVGNVQGPKESSAVVLDTPIEIVEPVAETFDSRASVARDVEETGRGIVETSPPMIETPSPSTDVVEESNNDIVDAEPQLTTAEDVVPPPQVYEAPEMPKGLNKKQKKAWENKVAKEREEWESAQASTEAGDVQTPVLKDGPAQVGDSPALDPPIEIVEPASETLDSATPVAEVMEERSQELVEASPQTIELPAASTDIIDESGKDILDEPSPPTVEEDPQLPADVYEAPEMPTGLNKKQKKAWEKKVSKEREDWESAQASTQQLQASLEKPVEETSPLEPRSKPTSDVEAPPANTSVKRRDKGKGKAIDIVDAPSDSASALDSPQDATPPTAEQIRSPVDETSQVMQLGTHSPLIEAGIFQQALEKVVEKQVQERDLQENITAQAVKGSWSFSSLADDKEDSTPWSASRLPPVLEEDVVLEQPRTRDSPSRARSPIYRGIDKEDSAYVGEVDSPKQKPKSWFDPEYVRDSGVLLREKKSNESQKSFTDRADTNEALVRRSWPPVDDEKETVDLRRKKRSSLEESQSSPYERITPRDIAKAATDLGIASGSKRSLSKSPALSESPTREFLLLKANRSQTPSLDEKDSSTSSRQPSAVKDIGRSETPRSASDRQHQRQSSLLESLHHDRTDSPRSFSDNIHNPRTRTPSSISREEYYNRGLSATPTSERGAPGLGSVLSRPASVVSNRSITPSLRRVSGRASTDLRAASLSQRSQLELAQPNSEEGAKSQPDSGSSASDNNKAGPSHQGVNPDTKKEAERSTSDLSDSKPPGANEGRQRVKGMAEVYNGFGEGRMGSPRSPTRPHSMRRKQSMQLLDMQAQMAAMAEELAAARQEKAVILQAKDAAERNLDEARREAGKAQQYRAQADEVRGRLESMTLKNTDLTRQTLDLQAQLEERDTTTQATIAAAVAAAIASKEEELQHLHQRADRLSHDWSGDEREIEELEQIIATQKLEIAQLKQSRSGASGTAINGPNYLAEYARDDAYFEQSCQKLFRGVWRWIHAFSDRRKHSISTLESIKSLEDARIYAWLKDAFTGNPSAYLADLDKRRLILMSLTMSLFHHYIFSKHFFGLDKAQEEASKVLEMVVDNSEISDTEFRHWRATQFCLFSKSRNYSTQRNHEVLSVTNSVMRKLSDILPQPSSSASDEQRTRILVEELKIIVKKAAELSNDMRRQAVKYSWRQSERAVWGEKRSRIAERFEAGKMNHAEICVQFMELHRVDEKLLDDSVSPEAREGLRREREGHIRSLIHDFHVISESEVVDDGWKLSWEEMVRRMEEKNRRIEEKGMGVRLALFPMVIKEDEGDGAVKTVVWKSVVKPVDLKSAGGSVVGKKRAGGGSSVGGSEYGGKHARVR